MQNDKELCETWDKIVMTVKKRYLYWTNEDVNPEILAAYKHMQHEFKEFQKFRKFEAIIS